MPPHLRRALGKVVELLLDHAGHVGHEPFAAVMARIAGRVPLSTLKNHQIL
jgi:hypothetical protein